jgi:hypothetical protein
MRNRARELKAQAGSGPAAAAAAEREVVARIAEMPEPDRGLAQRLHAIVKEAAPDIAPRLWYGMPAYARGGKVLCHFQDAKKFKTRYPTFSFSDLAKLDDGNVWPVSYAINKLTAADEAKIRALVKQAVG